MPKTRAKFQCQSVTKYPLNVNVVMTPVKTGTPENDAFFKYSPGGKFELLISNEALFDFFVPGQSYYFDITPAE